MKYLSLTFLVISSTVFSQTKLVVGIVVDQMSYDYLYRFKHHFSEKGFKKLMYEGTFCENTHYNYVPTYTGPGHASIYTGTIPSNHGIVGNDWFVRSSKNETNCVADSNYITIGSTSGDGKKSPKNLYVNTITDQLKLTYPKSKVISVSIKDRSAILPGGHLSDGSYWFDYQTGNMISSTFYKKELPKWVYEFNEKKWVETYLKETWKTSKKIEEYTFADLQTYEIPFGGKKTPTFPYDLNVLSNKGKNKDIFTITPFANTFLNDFAIQAVKNENLGKNNTTDFLAISFSTPDIIGHSFGPYSVEIEDTYIKLDLEIEKLINYLEQEIGKGNFILFLTADHAVVPIPSYLTEKKLPGGYVYINPIKELLTNKLEEKYNESLLLDITNNNIYLDKEKIKEKNLNYIEINAFVKSLLIEIKGIKKVYTNQELETEASYDNWHTMVKSGYKRNVSGDLIFILEAGYLPKSLESESSHKGTSHGSAFNYDTHVPLLWYGSSIPTQQIFRKINITDISATLAPLLNIQQVNGCTGEPIIEILGK